jgi:uncharacterized protein
MRRCFALGLALCLAGAVMPAGRLASQGISFNQEDLTLVSESGRHVFKVDVADNQSKMDQGLRYRHSVDPDGGLLIIISAHAPRPMQVSTDGLSLPIDLLFIASDGTVKEVYPWVPVDSAAPIVSNGPVAAALELAGGTITRFGILPGDHVLGPGFGPSG